MLDLILLAIQWGIVGSQLYSLYYCHRNKALPMSHWYGISIWGVVPVLLLGIVILSS